MKETTSMIWTGKEGVGVYYYTDLISMFGLNMFSKVSSLCGLVVTLIARISDSVMLYSVMSQHISVFTVLCSAVWTLIRVGDFCYFIIMLRPYMYHKTDFS